MPTAARLLPATRISPFISPWGSRSSPFPILAMVDPPSAIDGTVGDAEVNKARHVSRLIPIEENVRETGFRQTVLASDLIFETNTDFQHLQVYSSPHFGRMLVIDGAMQITETDGASYNEMMAHVPLMAHAAPKRVLVIGGGDGYVLSEVLRHGSVECVDHVELDAGVMEACKKHFPWSAAWEDPRVKMHVADGAAFVRDAPDGYYDVVVQDSSDPSYLADDGVTYVPLPSGVLYSRDHFEHMRRILSEGGVFSFQAQCYTIPSELANIGRWRRMLSEEGMFGDVKYGTIPVSTYPMGQIGFLLCCKNKETGALHDAKMQIIKKRFEQMESKENKTKYYHPRMHRSCFDLPYAVENQIYDDKSFDP